MANSSSSQSERVETVEEEVALIDAVKEARERPGWLLRARDEGVDAVLTVIDERLEYMRSRRATAKALRRLEAHRAAVEASR